jgi:glycosyltransferase involved in cell wall biosynthesis
VNSGKKKILIASCIHWNSHIQVGEHFLARQFAKAGWEVAFLSDPVTPLHLFKGFSKELVSRLRNYVSGGVSDCRFPLWGYVPGGLVMPYNLPVLRRPWVHDHWQGMTFPDLESRVREKGFGKVDVLFLRTPRQAFWLDCIQYDCAIYRVADNYAGNEDYYEEFRKREQQVAGKVDLIVYSAKTLKSYVDGLAPHKGLYLPNGVDFEHFSNSQPRPCEYSEIGGPIVLHVGSILDERFDFAAIDLATEALPEAQFVFVGPSELAKRRLARRRNLHLLGSRPYEQIPAYMQHADVGLIPFDPDKNSILVNAINPLKLYQYLASGLPVVARSWKELRDIAAPIRLADSREDFVEGIRAVLAAGRQHAAMRKEFSRKHDWKERFQVLVSAIGALSKS